MDAISDAKQPDRQNRGTNDTKADANNYDSDATMYHRSHVNRPPGAAEPVVVSHPLSPQQQNHPTDKKSGAAAWGVTPRGVRDAEGCCREFFLYRPAPTAAKRKWVTLLPIIELQPAFVVQGASWQVA